MFSCASCLSELVSSSPDCLHLKDDKFNYFVCPHSLPNNIVVADDVESPPIMLNTKSVFDNCVYYELECSRCN